MKGLDVMREVLAEARQRAGDEQDLAALAARLREHILDRWYRFAPHGVTSRAELRPITVTCKRLATLYLHGYDQVDTTISANGTPLESGLSHWQPEPCESRSHVYPPSTDLLTQREFDAADPTCTQCGWKWSEIAKRENELANAQQADGWAWRLVERVAFLHVAYRPECRGSTSLTSGRARCACGWVLSARGQDIHTDEGARFGLIALGVVGAVVQACMGVRAVPEATREEPGSSR